MDNYERPFHIIGLIGFIISGFIFIAVGINADDVLIIVSSSIWVMSCMIWLIPFIRPQKKIAQPIEVKTD